MAKPSISYHSNKIRYVNLVLTQIFARSLFPYFDGSHPALCRCHAYCLFTTNAYKWLYCNNLVTIEFRLG